MVETKNEARGRARNMSQHCMRVVARAVVGVLCVLAITRTAHARIAFVSTSEDSHGDIYTISPDGAELSRLTLNGVYDREPSWSPDGRSIVFVSEDVEYPSAIFMMDANGSNRRRINAEVSHPRDPTWSPDGTQIAFVGQFDHKRGLFVMNPDGSGRVVYGAPTPDDPPTDAASWTWSRDSSRILYESSGHFWAVEGDGSGQTYLFAHEHGTSGLQLSPDGPAFVYTYADDVYVVDLDGSNPRQLTATAEYERYPAWGPDSRRVVFTRIALTHSPDSVELYVLDVATGAETQLTYGFTSASGASWLTSGTAPRGAARLSVEYPPPGVEVIPDRGTMPIEIRVANHDGPWTWRLNQPFGTPGEAGGATVVGGLTATVQGLVNGDVGTLHIALADDQGRVSSPLVTADIPFAVGHLINPPSGDLASTKIAFVDGDGEIYTVPYAGGVPTQLTSDGAPKSYPLWSDDGSRIAYTVGDPPERYAMAPDGSDVLPLDAEDASFPTPNLSPDASRVVTRMTTRPFGLHISKVDGSSGYDILSGSGSGPVHWSPDGVRLAFGGGGSSLFTVKTDGTDLAKISGGGQLTWAPDGTRVLRARSGVFTSLRLDGSVDRVIEVGTANAREVAWSPFLDAFPRVTVVAPDLRGTLDAANGTVTLQLDIDAAPAGATWRWSVATAVRGEPIDAGEAPATRSAATIQNLRHGEAYRLSVEMLDGEGQTLQPAVTDESIFYVRWPVEEGDIANTKLAFVRMVDGDKEIFVSEVDGSNAVRLTHHVGDDTDPDWSPDGRIAFVSSTDGVRSLVVMAADGTGRRALAELAANSYETAGRLEWAPDGERILFIDTVESQTGAYTVSARGGAPEPLIPRAWSASWSPDGARLLYVDEGAIYAARADGSEPVVISPGGRNVSASWSPDGTRIAYRSSNSNFDIGAGAIGVDGSGGRYLGTPLGGSAIAWSPNGEQVCYDTPFSTQIHGLDSGGYPEITIWNASRPDWSPFLSGLGLRPAISVVAPQALQVFPRGTRSATARVERRDAGAAWAWRLDAPFPDNGPSDGQVVTSGDAASIVGLVDGGRYTLHTTLVDADGTVVPGASHSVEFSVSGVPPALEDTRIAYSVGSDFWTMRPDGTDRRRLLTNDVPRNAPLAWSPDGTMLAYSSVYSG
ncbi:MAG: hypothetical protein ABGY41_08340, partial [Candidatus Poribacteria bacterium]